jgi:two-component system cell cycle sensor histidine kinase/response regulator CckA
MGPVDRPADAPRILIVSDDDARAREMEQRCTAAGLIVCGHAGSREAAIQAARDGRPDLVVIPGRLFLSSTGPEEELRVQKAYFQQLFENSPEGIVILNREDVILDANFAFVEMFQYAREEVVGRRINEFIVPEEQDYEATNLTLRVLHNEVIATETVRRRKDGRLIHVSILGAPILLDRDQVGVYGIYRDITRQKQAEEDLRKSEERFRRYFELPLTGLAILSPDMHWLEVNDRLCEIFGYSREELRQLTWAALTPPDKLAMELEAYQMVMDGQPVQRRVFEKQYIRKDGQLIDAMVSTRCVRKSDGSPDYFIAMIDDVTEQRRAQEERSKLEAQLLQAQKMESLGLLAGGIAHDFNNLLMGILGSADLAAMKLSPSAPVWENIQQILTAARRAADLTRQMLAYTGKSRLDIQPLDLDGVVAEMARLLEITLSKKCTLRIQGLDGLPPLAGDPTQVRQVVMNLIINAADAMGDRPGTVTVRTGVLECDRAYLAGSYLDENLPAGPYVFLEVSDTGCGMDADTLARVFDPFFTTKTAGRGLGLAVVLGIVRSHKGAIRIVSEPGQGTTFRVLFPAATEAVRPAAPPAAPAGARKGSGTVLVADDEETVRSLTAHMLEIAGYHILTAAHGREALEVYAAHRNEVDLILLDLSMPEMSGEEVFEELRRIRPGVRILLMSGYDAEEAATEQVRHDRAGFIQKPFTMGELIQAVQAALAKPSIK